MERPAVFLDRDGTLNAMVSDPDHGTVDSPARPDQFRLLPEAGADLHAAVALIRAEVEASSGASGSDSLHSFSR